VLRERFWYRGFIKGLVTGLLDNNKFCYINRKGIMVWQEDTNAIAPHVLDIDYMNSPNHFVMNSYKGHRNWPKPSNEPDIITAANSFPANKLSLIIRTKDTITDDEVKSFETYIANNTNSDIAFNWKDNVGHMVLQAKDGNGEWRNIENQGNSFCGNTLFASKLEAGMYWTVEIPIYTGSIKTKLRAKLTYLSPNDRNETLTIYSNSFDGSINPAQFWRKSYESPKYAPLTPNID
jgi:hypothetical protein